MKYRNLQVEDKTFGLSTLINTKIRSWFNYYGKSSPFELNGIYIYERLREWILNKLRVGINKSLIMLNQLIHVSEGKLFFHWKFYR
jgi:Group II intron, maturase-specific domain